MGLIRYPGSKEKIAKEIVSYFPVEASMPLWMNINRWEYREPFFGAGAIGFSILERLPPGCTAWLNDKDYGIVCLWNAVKTALPEMIKLILDFSPTPENFYTYKELDESNNYSDPVINGFRKLALHQMSYSGLGMMSGGPLGGAKQENDLYRIDCRWAPETLVSKCIYYNNLLTRTNAKITNRDYSELIHAEFPAFIYLDPPYVQAGPKLYKHSFNKKDHFKLCEALKETKHQWVMSYDDDPLIRSLYESWACVFPIELHYSIDNRSGKKERKNQEIIITPG